MLIIAGLLKLKRTNFKNSEICLCLLFIVTPLCSYSAEIASGITSNFIANHSSEISDNIRYHPIISISQAIVFGIICFFSIVVLRQKSYLRVMQLRKVFLVTSTCVAIYALYGVFFVGLLGWPDLVPEIFDKRNSKPSEILWRSVGFSNEPGTYSFLCTCALLTAIHGGVSTGIKKNIYIIINGIALLLTFSAPMFLFWGGYFGKVFLSISWKNKLLLLTFVISILIIVLPTIPIEIVDFIRFMIIDRPIEFFDVIFSLSDESKDYSGGQRAATFIYGIMIGLKTYLLGSGPGLSIYYYDEVINTMPIYSKIIAPFIFPQNIYTFTFAEYGVIGLLLLLGFILYSLKEIPRNNDRFFAGALIGAFIIYGLAIAPVYATFIFFPFLLIKRNENFRYSSS